MMPEENVGDGQVLTAQHSVPAPTVAAQPGFDRKVYPGSGGSHTNT